MQLKIRFEGQSKMMTVHRLVAIAFIDNDDPQNKTNVDHIDEEKTNNNVDNLRWVTPIENIQLYNTKDGRDHHTQLRQQHKKYISKLLKDIEHEKREVIRLNKKLEKEKIIALENIQSERMKFEAYKEKTQSIIERDKQYGLKYQNVKGLKFGSVDEMVKQTGKAIRVNGIEYESAGSAARYIVEEENKIGNSRNRATVSKELRKYLNGKRSSDTMYERYVLSYAEPA